MSDNVLNVKHRQRHDSEANWTSKNPILLDGELGFLKDGSKYKIGDGVKKWTELEYCNTLTDDQAEKLDSFGDIITITKKLTLTTNWQDTGISGADLASGTYIIQVGQISINDLFIYDEVFSGIMVWYSRNTNDIAASEIPLHNAGHSDNGQGIYLRTLRHLRTSTGALTLQIAATRNSSTPYDVVFKFRRMI